MAKNPIAVLYDANGNPVSIISDGGVYRISTTGKIQNASGTAINPATQETLVLIKDTDGIKKITDALPTGDNRIGRVKITDDTNVAGVDAQNHQYVSGKSAAGVAPSSNPVSISGVDGSGLKRVFLTDTAGNLRVRRVPAGTSVLSNVAQNAASVTLLAANANRLGAIIYNDSSGNATLYVKFGATASLTSFTYALVRGASLDVPFDYTGIIDGIWSAAGTGAARGTELTV